ncbi:hypothetical protein Tco_1244255 [Tanacetum coccineum]
MFMLPQVRCGEQMQRKPHFTPRIGPLERRGAVHIKRAYYTQFGEPFQGGGYRATAPGYYQMNNANPLFHERRQSMEYILTKFMSESAKRHDENSNLIKEIRGDLHDALPYEPRDQSKL